ncbi:MAG: hypothetical protein GEU90_12600 [Gemmatimonas sp.]|nr:hypothetical protein [Gemmatimonas sp.]
MPDLRVPREEAPDGDAGRRRLQQLVERLLRSDEAAMESLMELYWDRLLWYSRGIAARRQQTLCASASPR